MVEVLLRAANDSIRPMSVIEVALRLRPAPVLAGAPPAWRLDPQYDAWVRLNFPAARLHYCPLAIYQDMVSGPQAQHTIESVEALLRSDASSAVRYALRPTKAGRGAPTTLFAVGSTHVSALVGFLFRWA